MSFASWLAQIAEESGWSGPRQLRQVLLRHDCHCSEVQLSDWFEGRAEPSYDKMRSVLSALQKELSDLDVWEHYRRFIEDGGAPPPRARAADNATLDSLLRDNPTLPPGLSDV